MAHARARRGLGEQLAAKRALLEAPLKQLGFGILPGQGAYFLVADVRCVHGGVRVHGVGQRKAPVRRVRCTASVPTACWVIHLASYHTHITIITIFIM